MIYGQLFSIGGSALQASQLALQVTGNNMANAATPGYSRQVVDLSPNRPLNRGRYQVGTGVRVEDIRRMVDENMLVRLRSAVSAEASANQLADGLTQIESVLNELSGSDISSELSKFFNGWSERANLTNTSAVVIQQGERLAGFLSQIRGDLSRLQQQGDASLGAQIKQANTILEQLKNVNQAVAESEASGGTASGLRDQRDILLRDLAGLIDISTVEQPNGSIDIFVGSYPIMLNGEPKPLAIIKESTDSGTVLSVVAGTDDKCEQKLNITGGTIGASLMGRSDLLGGTIARIDEMAAQLIFQVNRLHSTGANLTNLKRTVSTLAIGGADQSKALNDPSNKTFATLPFKARNGGFDVIVTNSVTKQNETVRIDVDLDGIKDDGTPGFEDDTSAADLVAAFDGIEGLKASFAPDGTIQIDAEAGFDFSFSEDSSDALATLGLNAFFKGHNAETIDVTDDLKANPNHLMVGRVQDGTFVENSTALKIAQLQDLTIPELGGQSIRGRWIDTVQSMGGVAGESQSKAASATLVRENLDAQVASISGVSIDEEAINLISYQRLYQAAARYIQTMDEVTQTLLTII